MSIRRKIVFRTLFATAIASFKFDGCATPTAVAVRRFGAQWLGKHVAVSWRTASEAEILGFNVFRSVGAGPFRKLNRTLIAARGSAGGAKYRTADRAVKRAETYTYRLQVVSQGGERSFYGIGTAAVR